MRMLRLMLLVCLAGTSLDAQAPLERRVSLAVRDAPLVEALLRLRQGGTSLAWRGDQLLRTRHVTLNRRDIPLGELLRELLAGTGLAAVVTSDGTVVLVRPTPQSSGHVDDVALATGIQTLDQLIVTGSAVGRGPERDQPTSVTVVTREDLVAAPHHRLTDAMRSYLPGLVLWDRGGAGPVAQVAAVRGVASFTSRAPKIYVDGVEVASPALFTLVDMRAVERIELINGPQGAALYGPDALNGVLQINTRKGQLGAPIAPRATVVTGALDRGNESARLWREGAIGLSAASATASLDMLGSVHRLGADVPLAESWRVHGGGQYTRGPVAVAVTARAAQHDAPLELAVPAGVAIVLRDLPALEEHGAGVTITHNVSSRMTHALTAGVHRISGAREPFRSPILPPVLPLGATNEDASRRSLRWAGDVDFDAIALSLGVEASHSTQSRSARSNGSSDLSALYKEALTATGGFSQGRVRVGPLMLSAGGRVEHLSSVGATAATPWAATVGASWTVPAGLATLRFRTAWGSALRPPEPGMSRALAAGTIRQEANAALTAERQAGIEVGAEAHFASGGWLRVTWFNQRADHLIQQVDLRRPSGGTRFYQFQNAGAIINRGVELDGGAGFGKFVAAARVHFVDSRVDQLAPTYAGEFEPGDHPLEVPDKMGSVAIRYLGGRVTVETGATWLGAWTGYDWKLIQKVEQGQVALRDRAREYWLRYGGVVRPFVGVRAPVTGTLDAWMRAEWPAGDGLLRDNLSPPAARTILIGIELNR